MEQVYLFGVAAIDDRIKTVVAGSPWTALMETAFYENKTVNRMWADALPLAFQGKSGSFVRLLRKTLLSEPDSEFLRKVAAERNTLRSIEKLMRRTFQLSS